MVKKLFPLPLPIAVLEFLKNEENAGNIIYASLAAIFGVLFAAAVLAIVLMS